MGIVKFINLGSTSNKSKALIEKIVNNPRVMSLCSLPVNTATMKFLFHPFKKDIPETQTGISKLLLSRFIVRHVQTKMDAPKFVCIENFEEDLQAYPDVKETFRKLCSLSYCALIGKKEIFHN